MTAKVQKRFLIDTLMNPAKFKNLNRYRSQLQYVFRDPELLIQALTHRSYAHENTRRQFTMKGWSF